MARSLEGSVEILRRFERWLVAGILVTALVLSSIGGIFISYLLLLFAFSALLYFGTQGPRWPWIFDRMGTIFAGSFLVLALGFAVSAGVPDDLRFGLNFVAFLLYIPLSTVLARAASPSSARIVAWLAFGGAVLGATYAIGEVVLTGAARAGTFRVQTDPIRLANTSLLLGFFALIGVRQQAGKLRYLLLTGPFFGFAAVIACGARNAMVAFVVMLVWASVCLIKRWQWRLLAGVAVVGVVAIVLSLDDLQPARFASLVTTLEQMLSGQEIADRSFDIRLELYRSALLAFGEAPIFGHGWEGMMQAIAPYLPEKYADQASLPHLHNELLNFALASGGVGVVVMIGLLASPLVLALKSPADSQKGARVLGCSLLLVGYVVMGLADTMISYETHTALYVVWTAILLSYCRDDRPATPRATVPEVV